MSLLGFVDTGTVVLTPGAIGVGVYALQQGLACKNPSTPRVVDCQRCRNYKISLR